LSALTDVTGKGAFMIFPMRCVIAIALFAMVVIGCSDKDQKKSASFNADNPNMATEPPASKAWPFDAIEAKRRQKETAERLGVPVDTAIDLGGGDKINFNLIPPGEFLMGTPYEGDSLRDHFEDEEPQHRVTISKPFYMGTTEVTQVQWKAMMGENTNDFKGDNLPVEGVSWNDCRKFLDKVSKREGKTFRLPTEAEWEYACRAGTATPFAFGETISASEANYNGSLDRDVEKGKRINRQKTMPVASFKPNAWGLYDMHGNVEEWCQDFYVEDYYKNSPAADPSGPDNGTRRVVRGGSWMKRPGACRSAFRLANFGPNNKMFDLGFRIVLEVKPEKSDMPRIKK
jgi:formylglycine-generating enzyme required for sulfatase activity